MNSLHNFKDAEKNFLITIQYKKDHSLAYFNLACLYEKKYFK